MDRSLAALADAASWTCWLCGGGVDAGAPPGSAASASVDHVVPRSKGGGDEPGNRRLAHRLCNSRRGNRLPELAWPAALGVLDPAPLWPALQRARRRPGEWETVAVTPSGERAERTARWVRSRAALVLGGAWEVRCTPAGPTALVAIRAAA